MHNELNSEYLDQLSHEKYRAFCVAHSWSLMTTADPMDILEFIEEHGEDADFADFSTFLADKS